MSFLVDLGHRSYAQTYEIQKEVAERVKSGALPNVLLFVEHDAVLTLGANFHEKNLLLSREEYAGRGIEVTRTDRGGDVTFHGPGQLVVYPIFDVSKLGKDLHRWLRDLEEAVIVAARDFDLDGERFPPNTGVWIHNKKLAAIGIKVSRWVSIHGIAINCDNDLGAFDLIVPCGIVDFGVTSLSEQTGRRITIEEAKPVVARAFEKLFALQLRPVSLSELMDEATQTPASP